MPAVGCMVLGTIGTSIGARINQNNVAEKALHALRENIPSVDTMTVLKMQSLLKANDITMSSEEIEAYQEKFNLLSDSERQFILSLHSDISILWPIGGGFFTFILFCLAKKYSR